MKRSKAQAGSAIAKDALLAVIDQAFDRSSWHGPNLRGSIRGVSVEEASRRPAPGRHNLWEQIVHAAYWKYVVRRRLTGEKRGSFDLKGSNWFERPSPGHDSEAAFKADIELLEKTHQSLREVIAALPPERMLEGLGKRGMTPLRLITGVAAHDVYHAGQINLLKRLARR